MKNTIKSLIIAVSIIVSAQSNANFWNTVSENKGAAVALVALTGYMGYKFYNWMTKSKATNNSEKRAQQWRKAGFNAKAMTPEETSQFEKETKETLKGIWVNTNGSPRTTPLQYGQTKQ